MSEEIKKEIAKEFNLDEFRIPAPVYEKCAICGALMEVPDGANPARAWGYEWCRACKRKYPDSLLKATVDSPFDYALRLRTGEIWYFTGATIMGDWVHLDLGPKTDAFTDHEWEIGRECLFDRGVDVHLRDIIWCADAPDGS